MSSDRSPSTARRLKSLLVCPTCGHQSPPNGDWVLEDCDVLTGLNVAYDCPDCGTTITRRPRERQRTTTGGKRVRSSATR